LLKKCHLAAAIHQFVRVGVAEARAWSLAAARKEAAQAVACVGSHAQFEKRF
jgi:hypothetical protein